MQDERTENGKSKAPRNVVYARVPPTTLIRLRAYADEEGITLSRATSELLRTALRQWAGRKSRSL